MKRISRGSDVPADLNALGHAVIFDVAGRWCALDLNSVANVLPYLSATPIPGAPHGVHGVTAFEERPTLLADLAVLFGFGATTPTPRTCILFVRCANDAVFGVLADSVVGVVDATGRSPVNVSRCPIPSQFAKLMLASQKGDVPLLATSEVYRCLLGSLAVGGPVAS
jgi:hypothetical protein